ncbi:sugar ABC transporter substrate-binding protein [Rhizobium sp. BK399]|uniref:sugar ABC transporter substrate-binding protein n=1 Tax=Rhizobium sp. BK399 TaxID=2587063 RepID=UPI00160C4B54|nr:sugar ABC transporter substrate-binding protein [Rhizobium sp. BK399]MBB3544598.1 ABC-type sugar transport system substrate-binding protein [Rhizobium sp. BK399]
MKRILMPVAAALIGGLCSLSSAVAQEKAVAMSFGGSTIELWNDIIVQMKPALAAEGYRLITHDPQFRVEQQVQDWRAWIAQGEVKAIMGWPINSDALVPVTRQAEEAGIPVIGYAASWEGVSAAMLTMPEQDGRDIAKYAVEWIKKNHGSEPVTIGLLSDEQNDLTRQRVEGIEKQISESLLNAQIFKLASISREEGYNAARQQLTAHPDTTVWLSYSNENLKGAYKALVDSGIAANDPKIFMAAMDVTNEDLDMIKSPGSIYRMAFAFRSSTLAKVNTELLLAGARGQPLKNQYVRPDLVTPETADSFYVGNR